MPNGTVRALALILAIATALPAVATAESDSSDALARMNDVFQQELKKIEDAYTAEVERIPTQYRAVLTQAENEYRTRGDLDGLIAVRQERTRFETEKRIESDRPLPASLAAVTALRERLTAGRAAAAKQRVSDIEALVTMYKARLDALVAAGTRKGDIDDALRARDEIKRVDFILADAQSSVPTPGPGALPGPAVSGPFACRGAAARRQVLEAYGLGADHETAVRRALNWLKFYQDTNGSWSAMPGGGWQAGVQIGTCRTAMTALALLAFFAHGETPDAGEYARAVAGGLRWLLNDQDGRGHFTAADSHEYALPIAAIALCEAYGMTARDDVRSAATKAVDIIVNGQGASGGWNYNCDRSQRNDTSYSGWCCQALLVAELVGITHPRLQAAEDQAAKGFKANAEKLGGFGYTSPGATRLTGVGVYCLQILGQSRTRECLQGLAWLRKNAGYPYSSPDKRPFYYAYYDAAASCHTGDRTWAAWYRRMTAELIAHQKVVENAGANNEDIAYWPRAGAEENYGSVYHTALGCLILQAPYRYPFKR